MASGDSKIHRVNIKYEGRTVTLALDTNWTFGKLREEVSKALKISDGGIDLVFQGRTMPENTVIKECDLGNQSVVNAIKGQPIPLLTVDANRNATATGISLPYKPQTSTEELPEAYRHQFYVYCKNTCKAVKPGKIRVRCKKCLESAFVLERDPRSWDDVLTPGAVRGRCHQQHCDGTIAEFFFKCKSHDTGQHETSTPLHLIGPNINHVSCIACTEDMNPIVVFPCTDGHSMCLECFAQYGATHIEERNFMEVPEIGYTLPCPAACEGVFVTDGHHFRLMGPDLYDRYQRFGAEEMLLQMGGCLCPGVGCGEGMLPEHCDRLIVCPTCNFHFCRECKEAYHDGSCTADPPDESQSQSVYARYPTRNAEQAAARRAIQEISKPCPSCSAPIEKNEGCMHMTCRCGFEFCWLCRKPWGRECQDDHWFGT